MDLSSAKKVLKLLIFVLSLASAHSSDNNNTIPLGQFQLNRCFSYKPNSRLSLHEDQIVETTDSIEFKDDCLRTCLKSLIHEAFVCRSLMHMPKDDGCKLTTANSKTATIEVNKQGVVFEHPVNYYENECAKFPASSAIVQAKLYGFRGGEGVVQVAQKHGEFSNFMAVLDDLDPNKTYRILYSRDTIKDCFKEKVNDLKKLERLASITTDSTGMAVQPWTQIPWFDILSESVVDTTVLLVDTHLETVFDCGHFVVHGEAADYEKMRNLASKNAYLSIVVLLGALFIVL